MALFDRHRAAFLAVAFFAVAFFAVAFFAAALGAVVLLAVAFFGARCGGGAGGPVKETAAPSPAVASRAATVPSTPSPRQPLRELVRRPGRGQHPDDVPGTAAPGAHHDRSVASTPHGLHHH